MIGKNDDMIQNLKDAGCNSEFIERFMQIPQYQRHVKIAMLQKHRSNVLDTYHTDVKRLECLDYLIYNLKKSAVK